MPRTILARMPYTKRNYMPPTMPTSFVPHSASNEPRKFRADFGGLFSVASYIVFVIVFGLAIGVFFYGRILATNQSAKDATLSKVESSIDPSTVTNFVRLRDRLTASETLLANHIAFSGFFTLFGTLVPTTVRFNSLHLSINDDGTVSVTGGGVAKNFNALAVASTAFANDNRIKNAIFSDIGIDAKDGSVSFTLTATLDPTVVAFSPSTSALPTMPSTPAASASTSASTSAATSTP